MLARRIEYARTLISTANQFFEAELENNYKQSFIKRLHHQISGSLLQLKRLQLKEKRQASKKS